MAPKKASLKGNYHSAKFRKTIHLPEKTNFAEPVFATITAARCYEFFVNGRLLSGSEEAVVQRNWKFSQAYDISKALHPGENTIDIVVGNTTRQPALLITGDIQVSSGRVRLDTDPSWRVLAGKVWQVPEPAMLEREFYSGHFDESPAKSTHGPILRSAATVLTYLLIAIAFVFYCRDRGIETSNSSEKPSARKSYFLFLLLFAVLTLPMAWLRPPDTGWDAQGHIDYVLYVANSWNAPLGEQGWQMYQPPAYYFVAAAFYKCDLWLSSHIMPLSSASDLALKAIQLLTPIFAILHIIISLKTISLFCREKRPPTIVVLFVVVVPMQIYVSSFISNEVFSAATISLAFLVLMWMVCCNNYGIRASLLLGITMALACLSKYTGLLIPATVSVVYGVFFLKKIAKPKRLLSSFLIAMPLALLLAGPFYYRNYAHYGKVLPTNQELTKNIQYEYRGIEYYLDPSLIGIGAIDKFISRTVSFVDGNYSSMWLDNSHKSYSLTYPLEIITYFLAIFPTFLIAAGIFRCVWFQRKNSEFSILCFPVLVFFTFAIFGYLNYLLLTIGLETPRAFYLLSQVTALAIFFNIGMRGDGRTRLKRAGWWIFIMLILYGLIVLYYALVPFLIGSGY